MNKKFLITGAGGYIGKHVVKVLCDMGANVMIIDRHADSVDERAQKLNVDIFNGSDNIFSEVGCPDICIHLAWKDGFVHNSDAHMEMLSKHYTFLKNMMSGGLKQLVVMGTMHEVGYYEGAIAEDTPCNPSSMYGIAKDSLRRSTFLLAEKYETCLQWLRAFYIYGDDARNHSIFTKIVQAEKQGQDKFPFTTGKNKYDFIEVDELAKQIAFTAMQTDVVGIINCCSGKPVSLAEKVEQFIRDNNFRISLDYGAFPDRPYDSPAVWGDADKINEILHMRNKNYYLGD